MLYQDSSVIIILILVAYIGILHYIIHIKSKEINTLLMNQMDENNMNENEDNLFEKASSSIKKITVSNFGLIKNKEVKHFIYDNILNYRTLIHYTMNKNVASKILNEGFRFNESFHNTSEELEIEDEVEIRYIHSIRKCYGNYVIVMCIGEKIINKYTKELKAKQLANKISVEQIIAKDPKIDYNKDNDDEDDDVYILPPEYIKGYFNFETGEIIENKRFDPYFDSEKFTQNINKFKV